MKTRATILVFVGTLIGVLLAALLPGRETVATNVITGSTGGCPGSETWDTDYDHEYDNKYIGSNDYVTGYTLKGFDTGSTCEAGVGYADASTWGYAYITVEAVFADSCDGFAYYVYMDFYDTQYDTSSGNTGVAHGDYQNCLNGHWYEIDNYGDFHDWFNNDWVAYGSHFS